MPNIIAHRDQEFVAISIIPKRANGTLVTPDADPLCEIFRVNPTTGILNKDLAVGTLGEINLSLVAGTSFLYSGALALAPAAFVQYEMTVTFSYDLGAGTQVEHVSLLISDADTLIYRNRVVTAGSQGTTYIAPTPPL